MTNGLHNGINITQINYLLKNQTINNNFQLVEIKKSEHF